MTCETNCSRDRSSHYDGEQAALVLSGEIDLVEAPIVADRLAELGDVVGDVVVDAAQVSFIDVAGCRALVQAADQLGGDGRLVVRRTPRALVTVMKACGWADHPRLVLLPEPSG